ncbi:MAG: chemotaxis protein CheB [Candidatus Cyclobacteriaceae bacterium M3_2C_046]
MTQENHNKINNELSTIVGIGASAGGLNALKKFFANLPENTGLAFVVVVHLSPDHKSVLSELIQPHTKLPVQQVTSTIPLEPDHVYVIPPGANLNTIDTHLRLSELEESRRDRAPIDHFFRTLSRTHDGHSIGVILTGTGSDGSLGIKEIKMNNGIVIVQDPNDSEFDGMPQNAIATGMVDLVLPLAEIPGQIIKMANVKPRIPKAESLTEMDQTQQQVMQKIFAQVRARTGRDFSRYKLSTITRRLQRRMQLYQLPNLQEYLDLLRKDSHEAHALSDDFLITVTNFFRDQEVYQTLEKDIIPGLFKDKGPEDQVRVWSVGCATGEEAYSLVILLMEYSKQKQDIGSIQLFASDLHDKSLKLAREGFYPGDIEVDVSQERLDRFFIKEDGGYRIKKEIREKVIFTPHNLLNDPPFSRLDMIVCRNLLIYLKREVQKDVYELFHYALRPDGKLVLGNSESLDSSELFRIGNKEHGIFVKRNVTGPEPKLPVFPFNHSRSPIHSPSQHEPESVSYGLLHQQIIEQYGPPSILVSPEYHVLHLSEHAGRYLGIPGGEPTQNVFKLVKEELKIELRATIHSAREKNELAYSKPVQMKLDGSLKQVIISVTVPSGRHQEKFALIMFEEKTISESELSKKEADASDASFAELENELESTQKRLQGIIEEYETSQEEMKASNEELQSANEELRSTMEELETSKEELQSMNEELSTVNQENRHKVEELGQLSSDLQNLLSSTDIATLFLSKDFHILRFTPRVGELFRIRPADRGRPITDLAHRLIGYDQLIEDARKVINKLITVEKELQDSEGKWYLTRILPYRSSEDRIEGVVITFVDITSRKKSEEALRRSEVKYRALIDASAQIVWKANLQGYIEEDSPSWRNYTGQSFNEFKGLGWQSVVHPDDREAVEKDWLESINNETRFYTSFRVHHISGDWRWTLVSAVPIHEENDTLTGWIGMNIDINEQKEAEEALRKNEAHLKLILDSALDYAIFTLDKDLKIDSWNAGAEKLIGYSREEIIGEPGEVVFVPEDRKTEAMKEIEMALQNGRAENERWHIRKDGSRFWGSGLMMVLKDENDQRLGFLKIMRDQTLAREAAEKLKQSQENLQEQTVRLQLSLEAGQIGIWEWDFHQDIFKWSERKQEILGLNPHPFNQPIRQGLDHFKQYVHPEDQDRVISLIQQATQDQEKQYDAEFRIIKADKSTGWISEKGTLQYERGKPYRMFGTTIDITQRKQLEQQKDDFVGVASHELKTPVAVMKGYVGLIEKRLTDQKMNEEANLVHKVNDQIRRITQLIGDLLDVTKIESGKIKLKQEEYEFDQLVENVVESMQGISSHKLSRQGSTGKKLWGDPERTGQVIINLISNAVKYSPEDNEIIIKSEVVDHQVVTSVKDHGIGIAADQLNHVFDRFYRIRSSGHKTTGLGLGLFISAEFVKRQGGQIWVDSEPGKGSVFAFSLPLKPEKEQEDV